jgi:hypothetical protein
VENIAEETFDQNLMRMIAAELHFLGGMTAAREMFGKGYFLLGLRSSRPARGTPVTITAQPSGG